MVKKTACKHQKTNNRILVSCTETKEMLLTSLFSPCAHKRAQAPAQFGPTRSRVIAARLSSKSVKNDQLHKSAAEKSGSVVVFVEGHHTYFTCLLLQALVVHRTYYPPTSIPSGSRAEVAVYKKLLTRIRPSNLASSISYTLRYRNCQHDEETSILLQGAYSFAGNNASASQQHDLSRPSR